MEVQELYEYKVSNEDFNLGEPAVVLVELARKGEIDPWDIDIVKITDKFLEYIESLEKKDLRIPARTLLYASILLRMKSDSVDGLEEEEPEIDFLPDEIDFQQIEDCRLPQPPIRRRTKRPVTLEELIIELRKAEMVGRRKVMRESWAEPLVEKAMDLSHDEGIEDRIKALWPILEDILKDGNWINLQNLDGDRIMNYISLLFLSNRKRVWLEQQEIFGDLFIRRHS